MRGRQRDDCPAEIWSKVDAETLKDQFHVLGVFKNGRRALDVQTGSKRRSERDVRQNLSGLQVRSINYVQLPPNMFQQGSTFYKPTTVERKWARQGYAKGQTVFILDDPQGTPWVMQAYSLIVDPPISEV